MSSKIKDLLEKKGVNQSEFAAEIGVSPAFVSGMLKGYKSPSVALLKRIADFLGVKIDELV